MRTTLRFLSSQSPAFPPCSTSAPVPAQSTSPCQIPSHPPTSAPRLLPSSAALSLTVCARNLSLPCFCSALPPRPVLLLRELPSASYKIYCSVLLTPSGLRKGARRIPAYSTGRRANPMLTHGEGPLRGRRGLHRPSTESTFTFTLGTFSSLQCELLVSSHRWDAEPSVMYDVLLDRKRHRERGNGPVVVSDRETNEAIMWTF